MTQRFRRQLAIVLILVLLATPLIQNSIARVLAENGYLSLEEAGNTLRAHMADRVETIDISFTYEDPRALDSTQLMGVLLQEACKHTYKGAQGHVLSDCYSTYSYGAFKDDFDGAIHKVTVQGLKFLYRTTAAEEQALTQKVQAIFTELDVLQKSNYEKAQLLYTYICNNVHASPEFEAGLLSPGSREYGHLFTAYSLVTGKATGAGFAAVVYRLFLDAGLECRIVSGEGHSWNLVKLEDAYYYLDASLDEGKSTYSWFLKGSAAFRGDDHVSGAIPLLPISPLDYGATAAIQDSGRCGDNLTWTLAEDGTLTVSGTGAMWNTKDRKSWENAQDKYWADLNGYIKKVVIAQGVTSVGNNAFWNCPQLTSVQLPDTLTAIGENAFALCDKLEAITLPNSVKTVGAGAFSRCAGLKTVTLSTGMTEIAASLFAGCAALEAVTVPGGITAIGLSAFEGCVSLKSCPLPDTLITIGDNAFFGAFDSSAGVSVTVPASVTAVGTACFAESYVKSVNWLAKAPVKTWTFYLCEYLEEITLSDSVTEIGTEAFFHCNALKNVKLSATLATMGEAAFALCIGLKEIAIPGTLKGIPAGAFLECAGLTRVTFTEGLETVGGGAFMSSGLELVTLPGTVKTLYAFSFYSDTLKNIIFTGDMPTIEDGAVGTVTVYYPSGNDTWTESKRAEHENVTWMPGHSAGAPHDTSDQWNKDGENHWKTCSTCPELANFGGHIFDNACDTACDTCGYTRTTQHVYDNACDKDCNVCGATRATEHVYDNACDAACNVCGAVRAITHIYDHSCDKDCNLCGATRQIEHVYDNGCDKDCNVCGATRQTQHVYDNDCDKDCNVCGATRQTEHAYDNDCDKDCNACGATRATEHVYDNGCDTACNVCGAVREDAHTYDHGCDTACNVCGVTRTITHTYDHGCDKSCNVCGATRATEHVYDHGCDKDCNVCGATRQTQHVYDHGCDKSCNVCGATRQTEHAYTHDCDATCNICGQARKIETATMYRLYNPNTGEHLYTLDAKERDNLVPIGWNDEGIAGYVPLKSGKPVYRLYNPNSSDHHYTTHADERDFLVTIGWIYEGVGWNTAYEDCVPLYRLFNPNETVGTHHYTGFADERDFLVTIGWIYEGVGWYGLPQ